MRAAPDRSRPGSWSLVRRLTGGVALVALLSFVAQAVVLGLWLRPVLDDTAAAAAEQALQVRQALAAVPPAQRPALAARLSSPRYHVAAEPPAPETSGLQPPPPPDGALGTALESAGIESFVFEVGTRETLLAWRLPLDGDAWWFTRHLASPASALGSTLAVWLALLAVATLGSLLLSVRLIARPIGELAAELAAQHGALQPLPVRADASAELQALVAAFNELAHQAGTAARARQELLAGVSHDLRTPLARLRLRAETQCEPPLAEALTADLLSLERIVNQFLAYVQGDSGALLGPPVPLHDSVRDTVQRYVAAGQPLASRLEPVPLQVPQLAVQRLLGNLIDNALAYGVAPVEVALQATGGGAELRVSDAGPGMSPADFDRAQQPFVRLTHTRSELGHCGLGLAIVAQVARQLGGQLAARVDERGRYGIAVTLPAAPA